MAALDDLLARLPANPIEDQDPDDLRYRPAPISPPGTPVDRTLVPPSSTNIPNEIFEEKQFERTGMDARAGALRTFATGMSEAFGNTLQGVFNSIEEQGNLLEETAINMGIASPPEPGKRVGEDFTTLSDLGKSVAKPFKGGPKNPKYDFSRNPTVLNFFTTALPNAFGSAGAFLVGAIAGRGVGRILGGPALAKRVGTVAPAVLGTAAVHDELLQDAKQRKANLDYSQRMQVALASVPLGASEVITLNRVFTRLKKAGLDDVADKTLKNMAKAANKQGVLGAAEEGLQEGLQQAGINTVAQALYDADRAILDLGVAEGSAAGGIVGYTMSALATALGLKLRRLKTQPGATALETVDPEDTGTDATAKAEEQAAQTGIAPQTEEGKARIKEQEQAAAQAAQTATETPKQPAKAETKGKAKAPAGAKSKKSLLTEAKSALDAENKSVTDTDKLKDVISQGERGRKAALRAMVEAGIDPKQFPGEFDGKPTDEEIKASLSKKARQKLEQSRKQAEAELAQQVKQEEEKKTGGERVQAAETKTAPQPVADQVSVATEKNKPKAETGRKSGATEKKRGEETALEFKVGQKITYKDKSEWEVTKVEGDKVTVKNKNEPFENTVTKKVLREQIAAPTIAEEISAEPKKKTPEDSDLIDRVTELADEVREANPDAVRDILERSETNAEAITALEKEKAKLSEPKKPAPTATKKTRRLPALKKDTFITLPTREVQVVGPMGEGYFQILDLKTKKEETISRDDLRREFNSEAKSETKILNKWKGEEVQTEMTTNEEGKFVITVRDIDSGLTLPEHRIFNKSKDAVRYAKNVAAGKGVRPVKKAEAKPKPKSTRRISKRTQEQITAAQETPSKSPRELRAKLEKMTLVTVKEIAKQSNVRVGKSKKGEIVDRLVDAREAADTWNKYGSMENIEAAVEKGEITEKQIWKWWKAVRRGMEAENSEINWKLNLLGIQGWVARANVPAAKPKVTKTAVSKPAPTPKKEDLPKPKKDDRWDLLRYIAEYGGINEESTKGEAPEELVWYEGTRKIKGRHGKPARTVPVKRRFTPEGTIKQVFVKEGGLTPDGMAELLVDEFDISEVTNERSGATSHSENKLLALIQRAASGEKIYPRGAAPMTEEEYEQGLREHYGVDEQEEQAHFEALAASDAREEHEALETQAKIDLLRPRAEQIDEDATVAALEQENDWDVIASLEKILKIKPGETEDFIGQNEIAQQIHELELQRRAKMAEAPVPGDVGGMDLFNRSQAQVDIADAIEENGQDKLLFSKSEQETPSLEVAKDILERRAKEHFGVTDDLVEAGYILEDGTLLDFSGRHHATGYEKKGDRYVPMTGESDYLSGTKASDHRDISQVEGMPDKTSGTDDMMLFQVATNAVRLASINEYAVQASLVDIPTPAQLRMIANAAKELGVPVVIDVDRVKGGVNRVDTIHTESAEIFLPTPAKIVATIDALIEGAGATKYSKVSGGMRVDVRNIGRAMEKLEDAGLSQYISFNVDQATGKAYLTVPQKVSKQVKRALGKQYKPRTPKKVRNELAGALGRDVLKKIADGQYGFKLKILKDVEALPKRLRRRIAGAMRSRGQPAQAVYDPKTKTIYMFANHVPEGRAYNIFLHEAGVHYGLKTMLGPNFKSVEQAVMELWEKGDKAVLRAFEQVPQTTPKEHVMEEAIGYLVENEANRKTPIVRKIIAAIKAFFLKLGLSPKLTVDDVVQIARGAVNHRYGSDAYISDDLQARYSLRSMLGGVNNAAGTLINRWSPVDLNISKRAFFGDLFKGTNLFMSPSVLAERGIKKARKNLTQARASLNKQAIKAAQKTLDGWQALKRIIDMGANSTRNMEKLRRTFRTRLDNIDKILGAPAFALESTNKKIDKALLKSKKFKKYKLLKKALNDLLLEQDLSGRDWTPRVQVRPGVHKRDNTLIHQWLDVNFPEIPRSDYAKITKANEMLRVAFDHALVIINAERQRNGLKKIKRREGYLPHFFHSYFVLANGNVIGSGRTLAEAVEIGSIFKKNNNSANVLIAPKQFRFQDEHMQAAVLGDVEYFKLRKRLQETFQLTLQDAQNVMAEVPQNPRDPGLALRRRTRGRFLGIIQGRTGAIGYETDLDYITHHYFNMVARYRAVDEFKRGAISLFERHFGKWDRDYRGLAKFAKDYINDVNGVPTAIEEMFNRTLEGTWVGRWLGKHYGDRPFVQVGSNLMNFIAITKLGMYNVASAAVNASQMMAIHAKLGPRKTLEGMRRASRVLIMDKAGRVMGVDKTNPDLGILRKAGIDVQLGLESGAGYSAAGQMGKVFKTSLFFFSSVEMFLRSTATLGAYHSKMRELQGQNMTASQKQYLALQYAKKINFQTNFNYGVDDTPAFIRRGGPFTASAFQFKKFPVKMFEFMFLGGLQKVNVNNTGAIGMWKSSAEFRRFWTPFVLLSGMYALPGTELFMNIFKHWFDVDMELHVKSFLREWMRDDDGEEDPYKAAVAKTIMHGIMGQVWGVDLTRRIGGGDFIPSEVKDLFGPSYATVVRAFQMAAQEEWVETVRAVSTAPGNIAASVFGGGELRDPWHRNRYKMDVTNIERVYKAMGFRLMKESESTDIRRIANWFVVERNKKERKHIDRYIDAKSRNDRDGMREAMEVLETLKVTRSRIRREERTKGLTEAERARKRVPKRLLPEIEKSL